MTVLSVHRTHQFQYVSSYCIVSINFLCHSKNLRYRSILKMLCPGILGFVYYNVIWFLQLYLLAV